MRRRSSAKRCLLCLAHCSSEDRVSHLYAAGSEAIVSRETGGESEELSAPRLNMAGAVHCHQLQRQLENIFVLRRLLDVPEVWCEETLKESCMLVEGEDQGNGPDNWFNICDECMYTSVAEAWRIYQQILALELKMLRVKERVKAKMKGEIENRKSTWRQQLGNECGNNNVEEKIRSFIFPELMSSKEKEWVSKYDAYLGEEDDDDDDDRDFEMDNDGVSNCSDPLQLDENFTQSAATTSSSGEFPFHLFTEKRGRGERIHGRRRRAKRNKKNVAYKLATDGDGRKRKKWYCCREIQCRSRFHTPEELELHYQAHQDQQTRQQETVEGDGGDSKKGELDCPHCPFPARSHAELETHMENRHRKTHRLYHFSCPNCTFKVQDDFPRLKRHFDQEHPPAAFEHGEVTTPAAAALASELPVICPQCNKRCESLKSFTIHQKSMHPEQMGIQVENLQCSYCGMKFTTQLDLQFHIKNRHNNHRKVKSSKFVCDECGAGFEYLSKLQYHQIKHVNKVKRDHVCHLCGLDYAYKWILDKHYVDVHSGGMEGISSVPADPPAAPATSAAGGGKEIQCKYCDFTCTIKGIMLRHIQQHKEEMGFKCEQCGKCYVNEPGLKRHLKINHPLVKEEIPCPYCLKTFFSVDYMKDHVRIYCKMKKLNSTNTEQSSLCSSSTSTTITTGEVKTEMLNSADDADKFEPIILVTESIQQEQHMHASQQ